MEEGELAGVEFELAGPCAVSIKRISHNGDAESFLVIGVKPKLVSATCDRGEVDTGVPIFICKPFPVRGSHFTMHFIVDLNGAVFDIETEWKLDRAAVSKSGG